MKAIILVTTLAPCLLMAALGASTYGFNRQFYGVPNLPSLINPVPCRANILREQVNYICAHGQIWCLPGWKNPKNYCRDPDCPEGCEPDRGDCHEPNICHCRVGYYGHACQKCIPLPGCLHGDCDKAYECVCQHGWEGIFCDKAVCREGCHPEKGFCDIPEECRCHLGWQGVNCTKCSPLPGCVHGTCRNPMECLCDEGWRGSLCDQPVCNDTCVHPFGKCQRPNFCVCELGYSGPNCDVCRTYPGCMHGSCLQSDDGSLKPWTCHCNEGWRGMLCDQPSSTGPRMLNGDMEQPVSGGGGVFDTLKAMGRIDDLLTG